MTSGYRKKLIIKRVKVPISRSVVRAIGVKSNTVLQPTKLMLKYLAQSVMTSFSELQWFRQQDASPMSLFAQNQDLSPTKERFL